MILRSIPLRPEGERTGGLVLLRDVTDLRRRDRELVTKDATIREIHHRVKNNLQTVAALLRLQARRIDVPEGRAALEEAVRRVGAIAVVHETLSQAFDEWVDFDEVADQLTRLVTDVGTRGGRISTRRTGSFGTVSSEAATPLAMVLTELVQNAVEHAFAEDRDEGGCIEIRCQRDGDALVLVIEDDGVRPARAGSPWRTHPASDSRSCAPWSASSAARSRWARTPTGSARGPRSPCATSRPPRR